jgi:hypothetical protein
MNKPGDGLLAPVPKVRDDSDPLSPDALRRRESTAQETLAELEGLFAVSPQAIYDASYPHIRRRLLALYRDCLAAISAAQAQLDISTEIYADAEKLDRSAPDNLRAIDDAESDWVADHQAVDGLKAILKLIYDGLARRE